MSSPPALDAWKMSFQLSPIILTGGIAGNIPGGMLPIISLTEGLNFTRGLLSGKISLTNLDEYFATFQPLPGATLISNQVGTYPFANQAVAANAIIAQPLSVSMLMTAPARGPAGYAVKLATMIALQATLASHNNSGGTYTVVTPSYIYTDCLMLDMREAQGGGTKQPQVNWQIDFTRPLLTLQEAQSVQNSLMSRITSGVPIQGQPSWSGLPPTVGVPSSLAAPSLISAATGPVGTGVSPQGGPIQ